MQKQSRLNGTLFSTKRATTVLCLALVAVGALISQAHAEIIELAHTPVAAEEGSHSFIKRQHGGYDFLQYTPTQIGDSITFSVTLTEEGKHHLQVTSYKDSAEGIYSIELDGKELARKDFYLSNVWEVGDFDTKPGVYQVTFRCVDKNPKSHGLGVKFGNMDFR